MKQYIKSVLVEKYQSVDVDGYGQISRSALQIKSLFGEKSDKVLEYIKSNPLFEVSTYGNGIFTYKAISQILDGEIYLECRKALQKNKNYLRNVNSY